MHFTRPSRSVPSILASTIVTGLFLLCLSCSSDSTTKQQDDSEQQGASETASGESSEATTTTNLYPYEPFDPPSLEEIEAQAAWIDLPVHDARELLRERLKSSPPRIKEAAAMARHNDSADSNAKILSVFSQLPQSDEQVDWEASVIHHVSGDAKSLNPIMINSVTEFELLELTGLQLIGFDADFAPFAVGWAVESWQTSGDRMMDKIVLRDDLTWSDGTPLTAHDVAFTYHTIMQPEIPVPAVRANVQKLRWVHAYDDRTVVMFHREPQASWTENIQFPIVPKHIYESGLQEDPTMVESDYHLRFEKQPVTCGPYEYVQRIRGQEIVLRRRESYYLHQGMQIRPKPFLKEVRFRVIIDPNTTLLALKAGEVDEARMTAQQWLTQTGGVDFYERNTKLNGSEWTEFHIEWNCKSPYFQDKRVRQAMAFAMDHQEMLDSIFYNLVTAGTGVFHPDAWMASKNIRPFVQDLDKAEDLLDEAGWTDSDRDGIRDKRINGRSIPFEFTLITYQQPDAIKVCTLLKDNLDQIGIVCHVKPTEFTVKTQLAMDHKFQALMGGWGTGTDPTTLDNIFATGGGRNHSQYSNPRVDEIFRLAQLEFDRQKRAALYAELHEIIFDDQPNLWLYHRKSLYGINKRIRGFNFSPRDPYGVQPGFLGLWVPKQ